MRVFFNPSTREVDFSPLFQVRVRVVDRVGVGVGVRSDSIYPFNPPAVGEVNFSQRFKVRARVVVVVGVGVGAIGCGLGSRLDSVPDPSNPPAVTEVDFSPLFHVRPHRS